MEKSMKLLILDGNSIINRAYYGVKPLTTREGFPTHAIYGFLNILDRLLKEEEPDALCVAFDVKSPTFRHGMYKDYKLTRKAMPYDLEQQFPMMKKVLKAMNIPVYECKGWEADDVLGTVGRVCKRHNSECIIVTGDRDSLQLINEHVRVKLVITKGGQTTMDVYDEEMFRREYGVDPIKMIDMKALMGDQSDNIPGVPGIGPKTASSLIQKFGSLDGVYANLDDSSISAKMRAKLEAAKDQAYLSYELATIDTFAPIQFLPEDAILKPYNGPELYKLFTKLEFVKLIDKYNLREQANRHLQKPPRDTFFARCESLPEDENCSIYVAPDGSLGMANDNGVCFFTPLEVQTGINIPQGKLICHDMKSMLHYLTDNGFKYNRFLFDTALASYVINPSHNDHSLPRLAMQYLQITIDENDAAACAEAIWRLWMILVEELVHNDVLILYEKMEFPICQILFEMEREGVAIDQDKLKEFGKMLSERIAKCEKEIFSYSGEHFNINSTRQLGEVLFEKLSLPPVKKTKTGYSTNADVLAKLKDKHPIIPAIMDYRMLTKLKSTYADGLLKEIGEDGRIHTTFQNMVTATGRLSSTDPNLQNIPVRTDLGAEIRKMFIPRPGYALVDADYSQIELRVLAHISQDQAMIDAFRNEIDIHAATASQVFGVPIEEVTPLQRRRAKAVNFGIVYGISEFSLAEDIGVPRWEAKEYIDKYLERYSGVKTYMKDIVDETRKNGYTMTMFGRKRFIPDLNSTNFNVRQAAERVTLNTPIQGTAADLIKFAMMFVYDALKEQYPEAKMILQVHDELIVECPESIAQEVADLVKEKMESVAYMCIPLVAEAKWGKSWYEAK